MKYDSLGTFLETGTAALAKGPVGIILVEDAVEVDSTIRHHLDLGFRSLIVFAQDEIPIAADLEPRIHRVNRTMHRRRAKVSTINPLIAAAPPGTWMFYCYNAEYLFFPFSETRSIGELLAFHTEERRAAMLTYVIDLYAADLGQHPNGVDIGTALLDRSGYYALNRTDRADPERIMDRQLDFFGGLRWRYEEFVPPTHRKIDRIALFRSAPGLELRPDHTFSDEEYNTYSCPWHHNLTAALMSFRVAKGLKYNPASTFDIHDFRWYHSVPFSWKSQQLMDLGLIEPGQWF
ncbi:glycosyltransferase family 2 protein [Paenirhodobacter enshiensis]|uniref:glycosyltransferase family 2 protein n=1 Tax=Paenirhodobacter enshiensis TaxID=1105367 RepID=UPI0035AF8B43